MPPAARITDNHTCPKVEPGPIPHVGGPIITGETTVLIGFLPAARKGDSLKCVPAIDNIKKGESTVLIGNEEAARIGDPTVHGGKIVQGCPTVLIGSQSYCLKSAAQGGSAFVKPAE
ncbi:MAG: PAAR domain-containing protein [Polyangiaceae bacterium]|nr:PAAR domain-containing protein [Polyangiaceae bacterium]